MNEPFIRLVAYAGRKGDVIFVSVPNEKGRYLRTDRSVAFVGCPQCGAVRGEPCRSTWLSGSTFKYTASTHYSRRASLQRSPLKYDPPEDVDKEPLPPTDQLDFPPIEFPETA